ncbi:hypothetical protein DCS32_06130 [Dokdonia sp. Dokd-P16]|uniref:hypothetical protein n=1 Tax=Dokdonia sp. Dokd-P16 TaxID=2173169 RepID=UPI000D548437|nr:hypothetical protein [Dokdonia sp. Dokd-P16]AWH73747.1 hypothetical protein DCS32_06130 [Dokdonia sp. Dokd-P16]
MKYLLLFALLLITSTTIFAQSYRGSGNYNRIGLQGKVAFMDIDTKNFDVQGEAGFLAGFTTRGNVYNNWGMVYGIDLLSTAVTVQTTSLDQLTSEDTQYNIIGAQLNLLLSYNLIANHLAVDIGPALLINSKMKLDNSSQSTNIVSGYTTLTASDIQEISRVNGFGIIGLTGGFEHVRLMLQYQYGFTNILNNLNEQNLVIDNNARDFKGNASLITAGVVFYL